MGRPCDCCGAEDCVTITQTLGFSVDRYKPKYYSLEKELVEEFVGFSTINEEGDVIEFTVFSDLYTISEDIKIGSSKEVANYAYLSKYFSYENVEADEELLSKYPDLNNYLDQTHNNTFRKRVGQRTHYQSRVIIEFDCSDIYDTSKDLYIYASLRLGDKTRQAASLNDGSGLSVGLGQFLRGLDTTVKIDGIHSFSDKLKPRNFQQWDDLVSQSSFSRSLPNNTTAGVNGTNKEYNSIDLTEEELKIGSSISFMLSPPYTGKIKSPPFDNERSGDPSYYKIDYRQYGENIAFFEFIRPPFGEDLTDSQKDSRIRSILYQGATTRTLDEDWHDYWQRVDDMFTFVSKIDLLDRSTDIVRSGLTQKNPSNDQKGWDRDLQFSMKVFKSSDGNKKSQIEKTYFDGLFYWDKRETKRVIRASTPTILGAGENCSLPPFHLVPRAGESIVDRFNLEYEIASAGNRFTFYGPHNIEHGVFESEEYESRVSFINNVDNSEYLTHYNPFALDRRDDSDTISITRNYVKSFSSNNWKNFAQFGYTGDGIENLITRAFRENTNYKALKESSIAGIPDVVKVNGATFFHNSIESASVKVSYKNTRGKFPHLPINIYTLGSECRNQCLYTDSPVQWNITDQKFSYPLLSTILRVDDADTGSVTVVRDGNPVIIPHLKCYTKFYSEGSRFEAYGEAESLSSQSFAFYEPSEDIYYDITGLTGSPCDADSESFFCYNGTCRKHTRKRFTASGRRGGFFGGSSTKYGGQGSWQKFCGTDTNGAHQTHAEFGSRPGYVSTKKVLPFYVTAAASYGEIKNDEPTKIIKDAGWTKKITVNEVKAWATQGVGFIVDNGYWNPENEWKSTVSGSKITSGAETDIVLNSLDGSFFLGHGIRYRYVAKPVYESLQYGTADLVPSPFDKLGEQWIPLYQQHEGIYEDILSDDQASEIARLTMGQFDYWYQVLGSVFIEDPAGDTEKDNKPGYYMEDPFFKVDISGKKHGPYKKSEMPLPIEEVAVVVETRMSLPSCGSRGFYTMDLDYDPDNPDPIFDTETVLLCYNRYRNVALKSVADTEPFGIGADPASKYVRVESLGDWENYSECNCTTNIGGRIICGDIEGPICDRIYTKGWKEPPSLTTAISTFVTPPGQPGCDVNYPGSQEHSDDLEFGFPVCPKYPNSYGYTASYAEARVAEDGTFSIVEVSRELVTGSNCDVITAEIPAYGVQPQGGQAERVHNRSELWTDAISVTNVHTFSFMPQDFYNSIDKTMKHKKIVLASELKSGLSLSFDDSDGVYHRSKDLYHIEYTANGRIEVDYDQTYMYFDFDSAKLTGYKSNLYFYQSDSSEWSEEQYKAGQKKPPPKKCPMDWPADTPYFCLDEYIGKPDPFSFGLITTCIKSCQDIEKYYTVGADNSAYGAPGDSRYDYAYMQASRTDPDKNIYSPTDYQYPWGMYKGWACVGTDTWKYETATGGGKVIGIIENRVSSPSFQSEIPDGAKEPFERCEVGANGNVYFRAVFTRVDIYKDYTFTIGVS